MTMTAERLAELDAAHDLALEAAKGNKPNQVGADAMAQITAAWPKAKAHIDAQAATIGRQDEALREIVGLVVEAIDLERIGAVVALDAIADVAHAALTGAA